MQITAAYQKRKPLETSIRGTFFEPYLMVFSWRDFSLPLCHCLFYFRQTHHSFPGDNLRFYPPLADQAHQFPVTQVTTFLLPKDKYKRKRER